MGVSCSNGRIKLYLLFSVDRRHERSTIDAVVMVMKDGMAKFNPAVWITAYPIPYEKKELILY